MKKNRKKSNGFIEEILTRNVEEIIHKDHTRSLLYAGKKLRVKFGIDPTSKDLHIGHIALLTKLKQFQELGHTIVCIIGDFTAMIGDPSGRSEVRVRLTKKEVQDNMRSYISQIGRILDVKSCEVRYNSEWYAKKYFSFFSDIFSTSTVQQIIERDDFQKRIASGKDVSMLELMYPLLQGYDSVAVRSDIEIGGTDQKFNMLMGRRMQRHFGAAEQDVVMLSLLVGTDGVRKMSKSFGNVIRFTDDPNSVFGKIMSIPDPLLFTYYRMATTLSLEEITKKENAYKEGVYPAIEAKKDLAFTIVELLYNTKRAAEAKRTFKTIFQERRPSPEHLPSVAVTAISDISDLPGYSFSKSDLRRLAKEGAITFDGNPVRSIHFKIIKEGVLRIGKKIFLNVSPRK